MERSPLPDLSLIKMRRYSTMTVQCSRGCPFNCEFCDIIEIYGRRPRTKAVAQVLAELDQLHAAGWREPSSSSTTTSSATRRARKDLLTAMVEWQQATRTSLSLHHRSLAQPCRRSRAAAADEGRRLRFGVSRHRDAG